MKFKVLPKLSKGDKVAILSPSFAAVECEYPISSELDSETWVWMSIKKLNGKLFILF